jgi:hypothetical protein
MKKLRVMGLRRARMNANLLTGNLRYNAITSRIKEDTIIIKYDGQQAHYWSDLEYGTKNSDGSQRMNPFYIVTMTIRDFRQDIIDELTNARTAKRRVDRRHKKMKAYEQAYLNHKYEDGDTMFEKREMQRQRSMNRVKGLIR